MNAWIIRSLAVGTLLVGGCLAAEIESPACPDGQVVPVSEAEAPEAYEQLGNARTQVEVTASRTAALANTMLEVDVVEISNVEYVERSPACVDDVGHRARAIVDIHTADGSFSARFPALVAVSSADGTTKVGFLADEIDLPEDAQLPGAELPEGSVVAGLALEIDDGEATLLRLDMAGSCTERATCTATERTPIVTWAHVGPDFDTWFDEVGP